MAKEQVLSTQVCLTNFKRVLNKKREKWKMNIKIKNKEQYESSYFQYATKLKRWYRDNIWKRKQWDQKNI